MQHLLDDPSILERKGGGGDKGGGSTHSVCGGKVEEDSSSEGATEDSSHELSLHSGRPETEPASVLSMEHLLSDEEKALVSQFVLDTQKRPGTVGVPAEGRGRGWSMEKIRAPRALTAVVSPRRSVDQPLHGPQVLRDSWLCIQRPKHDDEEAEEDGWGEEVGGDGGSLDDKGGDGEGLGGGGDEQEEADEEGEEEKGGGEEEEEEEHFVGDGVRWIDFGDEDNNFVGAHDRLGRLKNRAQSYTEFRGVERRRGVAVEIGGQEGLGVGGKDVLRLELLPWQSVTLYVSFLPDRMRAQGDLHVGALLLQITQLPSADPRTRASAISSPVEGANAQMQLSLQSLSLSPSAQSALGSPLIACVLLPWEGHGTYGRQHEVAATCIQRRQRGIVARVHVQRVREMLDAKWLAMYGQPPMNLKVVRCGDTFLDITWEMPRGMGLAQMSDAADREDTSVAGQRKRRVGKHVSVWGRGPGGRPKGATSNQENVIDWAETTRVAVAGEFEVMIDGRISEHRFAWEAVFGGDAHVGNDGILRGGWQISLKSHAQVHLSRYSHETLTSENFHQSPRESPQKHAAHCGNPAAGDAVEGREGGVGGSGRRGGFVEECSPADAARRWHMGAPRCVQVCMQPPPFQVRGPSLPLSVPTSLSPFCPLYFSPSLRPEHS